MRAEQASWSCREARSRFASLGPDYPVTSDAVGLGHRDFRWHRGLGESEVARLLH